MHFGGARRMIVLRDHLTDAVPETDVLRARRARGEEDLRRRRMRVLLEKVMLDFPRVVDAQPIGHLDLLERVVEQLLLRTFHPRSWQLMLVKDPEFHLALRSCDGS